MKLDWGRNFFEVEDHEERSSKSVYMMPISVHSLLGCLDLRVISELLD